MMSRMLAPLYRVLCGALLASSAVLVAGPARALESLPDGELSELTGQEGIGVQLELRINADANGNALTNSTVLPSVANASDFTNCANTGSALAGFASTGCRLALQFAQRTDGGGEWLVAKNFFGILNIPLMYLDSGTTPSTGSGYADLNVFKDKNGSPLLATPYGIPYLKMSFPQDMQLALTLGGLSVEYGTTGYLNNARTPFLGLRVGNSAPGVTPANLTFQGSIGLFGF